MASKSSFEVSALWERTVSQFRGLNPKEPGQWPWLPKAAVYLAVAAAVVVLGWFFLLKGVGEELETEYAQESELKNQFSTKLAQAVNIGELRKQKSQVQEYVTQLEKQLPGKAEMDALLSDINQAGLGRGLMFELFKPGQVEVKDYYAELPITIRVTGRYHDIGAFAADVANLSRIVTLHDLEIVNSPNRDGKGGGGAGAGSNGVLSMEAKARTYRYLDATEVADQQRKKKEAAAKSGGKK
jgi:type IV pilus assembly protein PilO